MAVDVSTLTLDNLTPEIMAQMNKEEIAAFKAKITPEQFQALADRMGGSQLVPPGMEQPEGQAPVNNMYVAPETTSMAEATPTEPTTPVEQKGAITFGRK